MAWGWVAMLLSAGSLSAASALICHNDLMALGALLALTRLGLTPGVD